MLVKERMTPNPITITPQTTVATALQLMRDNKIRRLPVVQGDKLIGIVTDRDLLEVSPSPATTLSIFELNYLLAKTKIADILPKDKKLIIISPDAFVEDAALLMRENKIGGIPVVDDGKLVGIITETNIFDTFIDIMGIKQAGYRITIKLGEDRPGVLAEITKAIASCGGNITHTTSFVNASGNSIIVFRINQGDVDSIISAINQQGYSVVSVQQTNA
ncbi:MAG: CBS and ACT domain-containing protein [Bacillota bacterium]|uniref:CBS domain-containing protein n=1 Tax=Thermanaerosceptrum fracticalcis TaxID=1712410 RepID=A0A7G6DZF6_THEFR|nr:CBS and ACT domain-containing protein [Thermanaerosceptrum fracticalcis]QNB45210.1 CBS domain-containing protein [Thermanaerosceptrum fracticalcis]